MSQSINYNNARKVLNKSLKISSEKNFTLKTNQKSKLKKILLHNHLTYKYILINGLLAKATNKKINPITLQSSSSLTGAYDARSLCHKVIVPFEKEKLKKKLGGSNEPFVNKPARYMELDMSNAVRRGKDKEILKTLIDIFNSNECEKKAFQLLCETINIIINLPSTIVEYNPIDFNIYLNQDKWVNIFNKITSKSCEGESLVLATATIFDIFFKSLNTNHNIIAHPVNQSGKSSNEVSDIDIFDEKTKNLLMCIEVKDKHFKFEDIEHAIDKVKKTNHKKLYFVYGPNCKMKLEKIEKFKKIIIETGFEIIFMGTNDLLVLSKLFNSKIKLKTIVDTLNQHLEKIRAKKETINHIKSIFHQTHFNPTPQ